MDWGTIAIIAIGGATLLLVIISLVWGTGLWRRREKAKIKVGPPDYRVDGVEPKIRVYLGIEFLRSGGSDIRYVSQLILKPDQELYEELRQYFELTSDGMIKLDTRIPLPRDKFTSSYNMWEPPTYKALPNIQDTQERDKATQIAKQLSQESYKIGLVWEDNGKITWKTVSTKTSARWV